MDTEKEFYFHLEFVIPNTIYPCSIAVSIGNNKDQIIGWIKTQAGLENHLKYFIENISSLDGADGGVLMRDGKIFLHLLNFPLNPNYRGDLSHEIIHAVCDVFRHIGLPHTEESEEAYCYYVDYLTKYIYTELDKYYADNQSLINKMALDKQ